MKRRSRQRALSQLTSLHHARNFLACIIHQFYKDNRQEVPRQGGYFGRVEMLHCEPPRWENNSQHTSISSSHTSSEGMALCLVIRWKLSIGRSNIDIFRLKRISFSSFAINFQKIGSICISLSYDLLLHLK